MNSIFSSENKFFRFLARMMDVILLSILWAVLCLPLVTAGPATAALYDTTVKYVREYDAGTYAHFFRVFRKNLRVGIPAGFLVEALTFLVVKGDALLFSVAERGTAGYAAYAAFSVIVFLLMGMVSYVFPLLSRFETGTGRLFSNALVLSMAHLPSTFGMGALLGISIWAVANYWIPIVFVPGVLFLLDSYFLERIFRPFIPPEEE